MDQVKRPALLPPDASVAVGQLIVKLRQAGLLSADDVQAVLRQALAGAAPQVGAAAPWRTSAGAWRSALAAE